MGAEHHGLGPVVQAILDRGDGSHYAGRIGDGPRLLVLRYIEIASELMSILRCFKCIACNVDVTS